jgi:hypothetical protein
MLLNRESNPGLPRLVVSNHMTTDDVLVDVDEFQSEVDAYAEIIATRPLGMWCTDCTPMDVDFSDDSIHNPLTTAPSRPFMALG